MVSIGRGGATIRNSSSQIEPETTFMVWIGSDGATIRNTSSQFEP